MTPSQRAYCDVALAINQRRNMFVALRLGLDGATPPKNAPRYRVVPESGEFFHIVDTGTGKVKGFRREHNAACAFARKLEQESLP